jgi:hypothetical protein
MNDPQFFEAARKLAERTIQQGPETNTRLDFLARTLISRPLNEKEKSLLLKSLERFAAHYKAKPDDAKALLTNGEAPADPKLDPAETATWTLVANQFLNLDETLCK